MSPLIRGGLFVVGFAGAVGLGYALKPTPKPVTAADSKPTVVLHVPPMSPTPTPTSTVQVPAKIESEPELVIPPPSGRKPADEPLDRNSAEYKLIAKELGHKTTLDDGPVVRTGGTAPPTISLPPLPGAPIAAGDPPPPSVPRIDIELPSAPATEPMPRLDPIPAPLPGEIPRVTAPVPPTAVTVPPKVLVNSRDLALNFEVTKAGPAKVKAVELWATRDGGKTWENYDRMEGSTPPFRTRLNSDGVYGFKLVFEDESGTQSPHPRAGAAADVTVEFDLTRPDVRFVRVSPDSPPGKTVVEWTVDDRNLDGPATRLEFSRDAKTWTRCTDAITNHGASKMRPGSLFTTYWTYPTDLGRTAWLRVIARDKAGNETVRQSERPERINGRLTEGKLTDAQPLRAAEQGPMPRVVEARPVFSFYLGLFSANSVPAPNPDLQIPALEPVPDRGPNPIQHLREWVAVITGNDPATPPTRVVGFARSMISSCIPIYSDGQGFLIPVALDRLLCLLHWPLGEAISPVERLRLLEQPFGYRMSEPEGYPDPSELRSYRDRIECNRQLADALSGGTSPVSAIAEPDWSPSTAKPLPGRPWIVKTGEGLRFEW
jgi:hypothetical protein